MDMGRRIKILANLFEAMKYYTVLLTPFYTITIIICGVKETIYLSLDLLIVQLSYY